MPDNLKQLIGSQVSFSLASDGESMLPLLFPGDKVTYRKVTFRSLKVNDLILISKNRQLFTHRVVYRTERYLITKGDNSHNHDGRIFPSQIWGKVFKVSRHGVTVNPGDVYLLQSGLYLQELRQITKEFDRKKIKYVFLKGLPIHLYYEKQLPQRLYADCDILTVKSDYLKAESVLFKLGFRKEQNSLFSSRYPEDGTVECAYIKLINGFPIIIDLHLDLAFRMGLDALYNKILANQFTEQLLRNRQFIQLENYFFPILNRREQGLYLALHIFRHNYQGVSQFNFLAFFLSKIFKKTDWGDLFRLIKTFQMNKFVYPVFRLLKKYYQVKVPKEFLDEIRPKGKLNGWLNGKIMETDIFGGKGMVESGSLRFIYLFLLSPTPFFQRMLVFFKPKVPRAVFWVVVLKVKNWRQSLMALSERLIALTLLIILAPILLILILVVKMDSKGPAIFRQQRAGKNRRPFTIFKIRTMIQTAETGKSKLVKFNEADGPVFKIKRDPRFTRVGYWIARLSLDELPQLLNIVRGEMAFVGPRPLPMPEALRIAPEFWNRFRALPGLTSTWVTQEIGHQNFRAWMLADLDYLKHRSFGYDLKIIVQTIFKIMRFSLKLLYDRSK